MCNFWGRFAVSIFVIILAIGLVLPANVFGVGLQGDQPPAETKPADTSTSTATDSSTTDSGSTSDTSSSTETTPTDSTGTSDTSTTETRTEDRPTETPTTDQPAETKPEEHPTECPPDQHPEGQSCVPNQRPGEFQGCPPGSHFESGNCIPDQLPPGCKKEVNPETHSFSVICESPQEQKCPDQASEELKKAEESCTREGGRFFTENRGPCPLPRCDFSGFSQSTEDIGFLGGITAPQQRNVCPTEEQNREALAKCSEFGNSEGRIINRGGCDYATCLENRQECPRPNPAEIQSRCGNRGVMQRFEKGCPVFECREEGPGQATMFRADTPPPEAYSRCTEQYDGKGELTQVKGSWRCIGPSNTEEVQAVKVPPKIPDRTQLLQVAFQLEQLKIELDKLSVQADDIAGYWKSRGKSGDEGRYRRVADMLQAANSEIEDVKTQIRESLDSLTIEKTIEFQRSFQNIKDGILNDILYLMLSQSDDVKKQVEVKFDDKKAKEFRDKRKVEFRQRGFEDDEARRAEMEGFNKNFKTCNPYSFSPSGDEFSPTITIVGLEGDACVVKAVQETLPPGLPEELKKEIGQPPYSMECKFTEYARGMKEPNLNQCSGSMLKLKEFGERQSGKFGGGSTNGPGGCKTPEECQVYCLKHEDECRQFGGGPQGFGGQGGKFGDRENFQGPGGCKGEKECMEYCQQNPQECQQFFGDQSGGFGGPPSEAFNRPQSGPGGCQGQEECTKYCSDPANAQECGQTGGGSPQDGFPEDGFGGQFPQDGNFRSDNFQRNPSKCPDGIWDEAEQRDPNLCPEDRPKDFNQPAEGSTETTQPSSEQPTQ